MLTNDVSALFGTDSSHKYVSHADEASRPLRRLSLRLTQLHGIAQAYENMRVDRVEQERRRMHDGYSMALRLRQREAHAEAMLRIEHERKQQYAQMRAFYPDFYAPGDAMFGVIGSDHPSSGSDAYIQADPRAIAAFVCVSGDSGGPLCDEPASAY